VKFWNREEENGERYCRKLLSKILYCIISAFMFIKNLLVSLRCFDEEVYRVNWPFSVLFVSFNGLLHRDELNF
jgi:hypothetical protein